jgi:hypothetical protein
MGATDPVPLDEYLRLTEKPYHEYRDGAVSPKALPTKFHSIIQYTLMAMLQNQGVQVFPELTVPISPTKYLVPDVCVTDDFPGPYPTEPVLLCCEILSPEDRLGAMLSKCEEYHAWGVPFLLGYRSRQTHRVGIPFCVGTCARDRDAPRGRSLGKPGRAVLRARHRSLTRQTGGQQRRPIVLRRIEIPQRVQFGIY